MRRRLTRFVFVTCIGTVAMLLGVATSMTLTPPGRALLARVVSTTLDRIVHGSVEVGSISGSFLYDLVLEDLVVRDTSGTLLANLPRVRASYRLPNLIAGQVVLSSLELERPTIRLIKHRNGRMNYEEVLGLGKGKPGGRSPLIEFRAVRIDSGVLSIATPWNPPRAARTAASRDSALRAERARPGRVIAHSKEGLRKVITLADLTARMSRLRIATPDRKPFTVDLDSLATRVSDPGVTLTNAVGRLRIRGDSAVFSLERGALPDTRFSGGGAVTWPADTILFDFQVVSSHVNLADLRWVSPDFPAMHGSGVLAARSESGQRTAYDIRELHLEGELGRVDGDVVALTDRRRGLGVRDMDLRLRELDLDAVRPYLDTLPFYGTLTGTARGAGFLDALDVTLDWTFTDAQVPESPVTTIAGVGRVGSRRPDGLTFTEFEVLRSDIDLRTVRRLAPAVILGGRLAAVGTLDGPLRNATFRGVAEHRDGDRPVSRAEGMVRLDTRAERLGLATDLVLDPLAFDGIRAAFPSLTARGGLRGRFVSEGTIERLAVDASLAGELGDVSAQGFVTLLPPKWGAEALLLRFSRLDLAALTGRERLPTSLNGQLRVTGSIDTLRAPDGDLQLALSSSLARDVTLDTMFTALRVRDSVLTVDTVYAEMRGARAGGSGTLGWAAPHAGEMLFNLVADSLIGFDTLLLAGFGQQRDTAPDARPLGGRGRSTIRLAGSLDSLTAGGDAAVEQLEWQRYRSPRATAAFSWAGGARPHLTAGVSADSVIAGGWAFQQAGLQVRGWTDSLDWSAGTAFGAAPRQDTDGRATAAADVRSRLDGSGSWWRAGPSQVLIVDSLVAAMPAHTYRLREMVALTLSDSAPALSPLTLEAADGSSVVRMGGRLPGTAPGSLTVHVLGLDVRDLYAALQRDTTGIGGEIGLDLQVGGTAEAPTLRGTAQLGAGRMGEFRAPLVQSAFEYADRRLDAKLQLWRTGEQVLDVNAKLPIDLAFRGAKRRQLSGPLDVRAHADSIDLGILEALTPAVRDVRGRLSGDVQVGGTWDTPRLQGTVAVRDGAVSVPGLGARFGGIEGVAELQGDSLLLRDMKLESGGGTLRAGGSVRFEKLARPVLALDFRADRFVAMNVRNLGTLTASTQDLQLEGPLFGATLTGGLTANSGVIYFADLVNKRVIDLEDPTITDFVDTMLIRRENLGAGFQNRFLDLLRIDDLDVQLGSDVWLRSAEANVQLGGAVRVSKTGREYNPSGTVNALRGSYTLKIGPVTRDFTVQEGTVQYEGTLNANLDIRARHEVRTVRGGDIPVMARIRGQLYAPKLTLESAIRPPISETDLVSYLVTGRPASEAYMLGDSDRALETGLAYFSSAFSSELERALIQDLGVPIDLIEVRPGVSVGQTGTTLTQLAAGWQIGRKTFLTFNAGFCPESQVSSKNLGVNFEFRFSREWRFQTSVEPTLQTCRGPAPTQTSSTQTSRPWQFGTDIFWEREF
jgi:hypothetical protein